ncbi:unnamed protein product [Durusdinium trenchii]|uniref:Uncharacterized protein n=1 Tax=Durusdinium trenchii TaxID=1381693 RepID=A0ABP0IXN7_9DINO
MFSLENVLVDPLYRPPLSLAIFAAALKYITTAWVLDDPLLKTSATLRKERDRPPDVKVSRLLLRVIFLILSSSVLFKDVGLVIHAIRTTKGTLRWVHAAVIVIAFSPNSVAAVAATCVAEVKVGWTHGLPLNGGWRAMLSESIAMAYGFLLCFAYIGPLFVVFMTHAITGAAVIAYAFAYDFVTLPWRICTGHMAEFWVAVPIFNAGVLWTALYTLIVIGYFWLVQRRYPELAQQSKLAGGCGKKILQEQMPHQVAARIIGFVREVRTSDARPEMEMDPMPLTGTEVPELANDRCILNDEGLTLLCGAKVLCSLSLPLVQLCVIVAAQVYLGRPAWEAAMLSFQERSWEHYFESLGHFAKQRPLTLLWVYL